MSNTIEMLKNLGRNRRKKVDDYVPADELNDNLDDAIPPVTTMQSAMQEAVLDEDTSSEKEESTDEVKFDEKSTDEVKFDKNAIQLSAIVKQRLDMAIDNLARQDGNALAPFDREAAMMVRERAELIAVHDNDLVEVCQTLHDTLDFENSVREVRSMLVAVQRNVLWGISVDHERIVRLKGEIDPITGEVMEVPVADGRTLRDPPVGLGNDGIGPTSIDPVYAFYNQLTELENQLQDANIFINALAATYGVETHIPYTTIANSDGSYTPVESPKSAIEVQCVRNAASRKRRNERQRTAIRKAMEARKTALKASLKKQ